MNTATKICKICGKEYPYCKTERVVAGVFRWQDVACCVEHGSEYLAKVIESRSVKSTEQAPEPEVNKVETPAKPVSSKKRSKAIAKAENE